MQLQTIQIADVVASKTNPRGENVGPTFPEFVASIKEQGVPQPILVRKVGKQYEVIAGYRRWRATNELGLADIPAQIVSLNDIEAREAQIVENLQREDIHPLDEGEAYRQLIEKSKYDVVAVAVKVGKSESFVRDRLVLTNLNKKGKTAFRSGDMTAGHASQIARLEHKQQTDAIEYAVDNWRKPTTADLRKWIQERVFQDSMAKPPWQGDEELQTMLKGCDECKGAGGDLFGKTAAESCTNAKCYANRIAAFIEIKTKEDPALVRVSANYGHNGDLISRSLYKAITAKKDKCEFQENGIVVEGSGIGSIFNFCRAAECDNHWATQSPGGHYKPTKEERERRKKEREKIAKQKEKDEAELDKRLAMVKWPLPEKQLDVLATLVINTYGTSITTPIAKRHHIEPNVEERFGTKYKDYETPFRTYVLGLTPQKKAMLLFETLASQSYRVNWKKELKKL